MRSNDKAVVPPPATFRCGQCVSSDVRPVQALAVVGMVGDRVEVLVRTEHGHRGVQALAAAHEGSGRTYMAVQSLLPRARELIVKLGNDIVSTKGAAFELLDHGRQITRACPQCRQRIQLSRGNLVRRWENAPAGEHELVVGSSVTLS